MLPVISGYDKRDAQLAHARLLVDLGFKVCVADPATGRPLNRAAGGKKLGFVSAMRDSLSHEGWQLYLSTFAATTNIDLISAWLTAFPGAKIAVAPLPSSATVTS